MAAVKAIRQTRRISRRWRPASSASGIFWRNPPARRTRTGSGEAEVASGSSELQLHIGGAAIGEEATRLKKEKKYRKALEKISELRPAVDFFFDKVLVMAEDEEVRRNRIALLGNLLKEFSTIADFSELGCGRIEVKST